MKQRKNTAVDPKDRVIYLINHNRKQFVFAETDSMEPLLLRRLINSRAGLKGLFLLVSMEKDDSSKMLMTPLDALVLGELEFESLRIDLTFS